MVVVVVPAGPDAVTFIKEEVEEEPQPLEVVDEDAAGFVEVLLPPAKIIIISFFLSPLPLLTA